MPAYSGWGEHIVEVGDIREYMGNQNNITEKWQAFEQKSTGIFINLESTENLLRRSIAFWHRWVHCADKSCRSNCPCSDDQKTKLAPSVKMLKSTPQVQPPAVSL